ncbi:MAG: capsule assembly Wzi family protein [Gemmatimonadaceae bacterium]
MSKVCPVARVLLIPGGTRAVSWCRGPAQAYMLVAAMALVNTPAYGQSNAGGRSEVFAGSEMESYLRYIQTAGKSPPYTWSIRGFSPSEVDGLASTDARHPWAARYSLGRQSRTGFTWDYIRPTLGFSVNSAYPFGGNDGVVWTGKGLTTTFQAGVAARYGAFSATLAPVAFRAENQSFPLLSNGLNGRLRFADGQFPFGIDRPQRFGTAPYTRIDLGESTIRVDAGGVGAGLSTASQWWGPTTVYPYVLGNNAGGFPHAFIGSSRPASIGIGSLHGRLVYGTLDQSPYSSVTGPDYFQNFELPGKRRFMAGLVGVAQIRGIRGLEIGGTRFFHAATQESGFSASNLKLPLQNIFKRRLQAEDTVVLGDNTSLRENQLASLFLRWAPPASGFEVYGEYGREDFAADLRDLLLEPDHAATTNIGFRKAWLGPVVMNAIRGEVFTFEASAGTRTRGEGSIYLHAPLRQGHTNRGQMLGANVGPGSGSAQMFAFDRFTQRGRITAFVSRVTNRELQSPGYVTGPAIAKPVDVQNSLGTEVGRFVGPFDITGKAVVTSNLNRNFRGDRLNGTLALVVRQNF